VPFKYTPTPKPRVRTSRRDKRLAGGSPKVTSFTWTDIRKLLVPSIRDKTLEGRYESLVGAVSYAEDC
jgi:hypothetical protein